MESLSVSERLPVDYAVQYIPGLYNSDSFLEANNSLPQLHFYLTDTDRKAALGHISFSIEEGEAMSPFKAPFAGFELAPDIDSLSCLYFLHEVQRRLQERGVRYVKIKTAPGCYLPGNTMLADNMRHLGFEEKEIQTYHVIMVNEQPLASQIAAMEQRKLRKALKEKLSFRFARRSEYPLFFDFIKRHREAKGHQLSMNWNDLKGAVRAKPEGYLAVGVFKEEEMIAASVLTRVSEKVVYNFFPAHNAGYNSLSPMVYLIDSVYTWCQKQGIDWIDLGTSYLSMKKNKSLISFKEHMGGRPFESITFRKTLSLEQNYP